MSIHTLGKRERRKTRNKSLMLKKGNESKIKEEILHE